MTRIEHISEVLPHVKDRKEFVIAERDGYTVIDYTVAFADSFNHPILRECRGLKFNNDGDLIARPFGKFFNIGERETTQPHLIDFSKPHIIMDKLDGSMIHPCIVGNEIVFMTRMGRSNVARQAEKLFLSSELSAFCRVNLLRGITPIFEYTGPKNRIIIKYAEPSLTLLAARETISGRYLPHDELERVATSLNISLIPLIHNEWSDALAFLGFVRVLQGKEGFVIHFDPEHEEEPERLLLKCKGEDYVLKHKTKDALHMEKNVLAIILQNGLDDVLPLLIEEDIAAVEAYRKAVQDGMSATVAKLEQLVQDGANLDQKTFAVEHLAGVPSDLRGLAFSVRRSGSAEDEVKKFLLKNCGTQTAVDSVRHFFGADFTI